MQDCDLFVRVPFVVTPCSYLAGAFSPHTAGPVKDSYLRALSEEMRQFKGEGLRVRSLYIGGGAATTLSVAQIDFLDERLRDAFGRLDCPIAITCDPGLLSSAALARWLSMGASRLVFRYFSSDPVECEQLGMTCSSADMRNTHRVLECAANRVIDMQVLVGLAGQTAETLIGTLEDSSHERAMHYEFLPYDSVIPDADALRREAELFAVASEWMEEHGFRRYAAACFAKDGAERPDEVHRYRGACQLGIGAGCASALGDMAWVNTANVDAYILGAGDPSAIVAGATELDSASCDLRASFDALYHLGEIPYRDAHAELVAAGFLRREGDAVALSNAGAMHFDSVFARMA